MGSSCFEPQFTCKKSPIKGKVWAQYYLIQILTLGSNCALLVTLTNQVTDLATREMFDSGAWPAQSPTDLTLHQGILEQTPPLVQQGAHPVPACVHLGQAILQSLALLTASPGELGAAQVDGEDDGFAVVHSFLELLEGERRTTTQGK